jgi:TolB-like protein
MPGAERSARNLTRGALRVAAAYAAIAWVLLQVASVVTRPFGLPAWTMRALITAAVAGLPAVLLTAWFRGTAAATPAALPSAVAGETDPPSIAPLRVRVGIAVIALLLAVIGVLLVRYTRLGEPPPPANPAIAVLPFHDAGGDPAQAAFGEGLAEEVVDRLGRVPGLRVVASNSSFRLRDAEPRDVAARLGVTTVLLGTVRRSPQRLRLAARLVDGRSGYVLWSGSFDREPRDVFTVQEELATAVVNAIVPSARGEEAPVEAALPSPRELSAYDLYLIGRQGEWQRTQESVQRSLSALERSIELNPEYAPAHAQLALTLFTAAGYTATDPAAAFDRAEVAARRALALDSRLPAAHVALARVQARRGASVPAALAELRRALDLNPNYAAARFQYSVFLAMAGREVESKQWEEKTLQVDPLALTARGNLIADLHAEGDIRRRDAELARMEQLFDTDADGMTMLARIRVRLLDDPVGAAGAARKALRLAPVHPTPDAAMYLHRALVAVGALDEARRLRESTDWRADVPARWANEWALEAAGDPDRGELDAPIAALQVLPADATRDAALLYWLTLRGRYAEAAPLRDSAERSGPLHTYAVTGLERDSVILASVWVAGQSERREDFLRLVETTRAELKDDIGPHPPTAGQWLETAMLESCRQHDEAAIAALGHAFGRAALPTAFSPRLPWFARLAGQPPYDRLVARWESARASARTRLLAQQEDE